jgi:type I restriction enzyme S subunit
MKRVPELRFKEFSGEWEEKKLGDIGKIIGGGTPETSKSEYWNGDIPWVSSSDIFEENIQHISVTRYINEKAIKNSATKLIPKNSILFVSRVGVGKLAVSKLDLCTSQDFSMSIR